MNDREWLYSKAFGALVTKHDTFEVASVTLATAIEYGERCRSEGRGTCKFSPWNQEKGTGYFDCLSCSKCEMVVDVSLVADFLYCPNCGAEVEQ